jgi:tripartite-type tricarboxylate transporter receptor subunit TctC
MNGNAMFARRRLPAAVLAAATVIAVILGCPADAAAQTYPERSVRMLIAFAAGGTIDTLGRVLARKLTETWGQNVLVENRPGASDDIGAQAAA